MPIGRPPSRCDWDKKSKDTRGEDRRWTTRIADKQYLQISSSRMAFKPFLFLTLLLLQLSTAATAQQQDSRIPSEITDLVPSCARECFRSYIVANFGLSGCGSSPSLQCLCTKTGASGYTLGEGAFSCSVAEAGRGNCKGTDADCEYSLRLTPHMSPVRSK